MPQGWAQTAVASGAALGAAIEQAESQLGPVDVCIAAAGAAMPKYFEELRLADYERMMTVNYYGVLHAARHNKRIVKV